LFGRLIAWIDVRVVFSSQLAVGSLDFVLRGAPLDAKGLVVISEGYCHVTLARCNVGTLKHFESAIITLESCNVGSRQVGTSARWNVRIPLPGRTLSCNSLALSRKFS